jgi:transposase-like protein
VCNSETKDRRTKKRLRCLFKQSIFKKTFFSHAHLSILKILLFAKLFCYANFSFEVTVSELKISSRTFTDWNSFCREVCISYCYDNTKTIGGEGTIVEIDEAKFGKRKFNVGRLLCGQWVFGGIERGSNNLFLVPVERRDSVTLLAIIKQYILPGTTIISDCWKAYDCLEQEGFIHLKVNHSLNFVDPVTHAHTQSIESLWKTIKGWTPRYGRRKKFFIGYLARAYFLKTQRNPDVRLHKFLQAAANLYNPGY